MDEVFLDVRDLNVKYTSGGKLINAVNGVSFSLKHGETLGLVGETGAGKTTIAKSIMQILPVPPAKITGGEIFLEQKDLLKNSDKEMQQIRGNKIAMIFQDPMTALNPVMTVGSQILEVIAKHNPDLSRKECVQRATEMLEMVSIPGERYNEYPHQFSGGMKQRVVIAMALACSPDLLIADEPTTALDVTIQAQVLDMIKDLQKRINTSMILITHDLGVVAETCDSVAVIYAGKIVEYGTKSDVFRHTAHPYTKGLFGSVPKIGDKAPRLQPILGLPPDPSDLPSGCKFNPRCPYATDACRTIEPDMTEVEPGHYSSCLRCKEE